MHRDRRPLLELPQRLVTGSRAARTAGKRPPTKPIASAHFNPAQSRLGRDVKLKATWAKPPAMVETL